MGTIIKKIFCAKLNTLAEQLPQPPFPGAFGEKIFNHVSKQAWSQWLSHQTMLINEYRLNLFDAKSRAFLQEEMEKFFFGAGSQKPTGYKEPPNGA